MNGEPTILAPSDVGANAVTAPPPPRRVIGLVPAPQRRARTMTPLRLVMAFAAAAVVQDIM